MVQYTVGKKQKSDLVLVKTHLKQYSNFIIENCYFTFGNVTMKEDIVIPMGIGQIFFYIPVKKNTCHD